MFPLLDIKCNPKKSVIMIARTKEVQQLKFPYFFLSEKELDTATKVFSASAINCMHRQIWWHANFVCALMMSKSLSLEPTALHFTQHIYGVAIARER